MEKRAPLEGNERNPVGWGDVILVHSLTSLG